MKKNVGFIDRLVRFVAFDLLLGASLLGVDIPLGLANAAFVLSMIIAVPMLIGYSPVYHLLGISTYPQELATNEVAERSGAGDHE